MNKFSPDQNIRRNNLRFLHGLPHIVVSKLWGAYAWDKDFVLKMQGGAYVRGGLMHKGGVFAGHYSSTLTSISVA